MKLTRIGLVVGLALLLALASASAGASGTRPRVALTASPAHVELAGSGRATVRVTNSGASRVVLNVRRAGFALDLRGEPKIVGQDAGRRSAAAWLGFRPRTLTLGPGASGSVTIASNVPARVEPGDHDAEYQGGHESLQIRLVYATVGVRNRRQPQCQTPAARQFDGRHCSRRRRAVE